MSKRCAITVVPGDGTGPEVVAEGLKVLHAAADRGGHVRIHRRIGTGQGKINPLAAILAGQLMPDGAAGWVEEAARQVLRRDIKDVGAGPWSFPPARWVIG